MAMKQVLEAFELLSGARVNGAEVAALLRARGIEDVTVEHVQGDTAATDFVSCHIPGADASRPTLGVVGRLGGLGARPETIGLVSDADGAITAIAMALKLADMAAQGDVLPGPVRIHTHICTHAATRPNSPVPMMRSPMAARQMMQREVHPRMDAILSVDTTRGNRLVNHRGVAITPVAREGWLLPIPDAILDILGWVSGELPVTLPLTTQDITPQENGLPRINSIMQPATVGSAPVIGVALTAQTTVPGCATGVSNATDLDVATRFCIEVAKRFTAGSCAFHDEANWQALQRRYGSLQHLQTLGEEA
ncbi:MAG TPA: DUF1177 domain-containing protein [Ramlibacter sp.]|nr:DUF1177 domain-containing protein [Ramlibacter sp.]